VLCATDCMNPIESDGEDYVMLHRQGREACAELLKERKLLPRDLAVLWGLTIHLHWRSGRVKVTAKCLAEQLGMRIQDVTNSLKRLRDNLVISKAYDQTTGETYFLFNPWYVSVGGAKRRGHIHRQFTDSLE
jgi:DNA-binding transcriptional ArsR family regulator